MTRLNIINYLIQRNGSSTYLEIGTDYRPSNIDRVICSHKIGIDPNPKCLPDFVGTSDQFFIQNREMFDFIFIDGNHDCDAVDRDIINSLNVLSENGILLCHDCLPEKEEHQFKKAVENAWNGDVWKSIAKIRTTRTDLNVCVLDTDYGCGIITRGYNVPLYDTKGEDIYTWTYFQSHRNELLNVVPPDSLYSM